MSRQCAHTCTCGSAGDTSSAAGSIGECHVRTFSVSQGCQDFSASELDETRASAHVFAKPPSLEVRAQPSSWLASTILGNAGEQGVDEAGKVSISSLSTPLFPLHLYWKHEFSCITGAEGQKQRSGPGRHACYEREGRGTPITLHDGLPAPNVCVREIMFAYCLRCGSHLSSCYGLLLANICSADTGLAFISGQVVGLP